MEYDGFTNATEYALVIFHLWARIKGLSDGLATKKELAKKVGEPLFTVVVNEAKLNLSRYLCVAKQHVVEWLERLWYPQPTRIQVLMLAFIPEFILVFPTMRIEWKETSTTRVTS